MDEVKIYPASHYITSDEKKKRALETIEAELEEQLAWLNSQGKLLEAQRLEMRTRHDLEMIAEVGSCNGIENYSRHLTGRAPGEAPATLLDYFHGDFLLFIDESHVSVPQVGAMFGGDRSRKLNLVEHGFRLPSAIDNRPLTLGEFEKRINQVIYVSATPAQYELTRAEQVCEQIIRPTGLVDPAVEVRPVQGQIDDLIAEIRVRAERNERVLVTTLTKKMAEDLTDYLDESGIRVRYMHSEVETLDRVIIIRDLRLGKFDVLVGINLLREGLDLPEVSLVAILDADREGFLRSETSLIQTIGRAARNVQGLVIMYADHITDSMRKAISETERRRRKQTDFNAKHGITPESIHKEVRAIIQATEASEEKVAYEVTSKPGMTWEEIQVVANRLEEEMLAAAKDLDFERAAKLRDEMLEWQKLLPSTDEKIRPAAARGTVGTTGTRMTRASSAGGATSAGRAGRATSARGRKKSGPRQ